MNPVDNLLARLDGVRKSGRGWTAKCPAHEDRTASLSIASGDNDFALLHCFAGCRAIDVVESLGLELADLFPERIPDVSVEGRRSARAAFRQTQWAAALGVLSRESTIVLVAANAVDGLSADDRGRLALAVERITDAREALS